MPVMFRIFKDQTEPYPRSQHDSQCTHKNKEHNDLGNYDYFITIKTKKKQKTKKKEKKKKKGRQPKTTITIRTKKK